jgi:hypothetical protein
VQVIVFHGKYFDGLQGGTGLNEKDQINILPRVCGKVRANFMPGCRGAGRQRGFPARGRPEGMSDFSNTSRPPPRFFAAIKPLHPAIP